MPCIKSNIELSPLFYPNMFYLHICSTMSVCLFAWNEWCWLCFVCEGARARAPTPYCLFCANLREMCVMACSQSAHNETNKIIIKLYYDSQACFIPMNSICLCSFMCVFVCVWEHVFLHRLCKWITFWPRDSNCEWRVCAHTQSNPTDAAWWLFVALHESILNQINVYFACQN